MQLISINSIKDKYLISYMFAGKSNYDVWQKGSGELIARFDDSQGDSGFHFETPSGEIVSITPSYIDDKNAYFIIQAISVVDKIDGVNENDNPIILHMSL